VVLFGAAVRHVYIGNNRLGSLGEVVLRIAEFPSLTMHVFKELKEGTNLLLPNRFTELDGFRKSGVIPQGAKDDPGFLLLSTYDKHTNQSLVKLVKISADQALHEWIPEIRELAKLDNYERPFNKPVQQSSFRMNHPLILEDGGLIFQNESSLYKIDACSKVKWFIKGTFHHSNEMDADGNIWVPGVMNPSSYDGFLSHRDDSIVKISPQGQVLYEKSVARMLEENGYRGLLGIGFGEDPIHLNDIQPALSDSDFWKKGDLLISIRNRNTVFLFHPETEKITWLRTGPWMAQHDGDFISDHEISVYGNDVISNPRFKGNQGGIKLMDGYNNVYIYDFRTDSMSLPYLEIMKAMDVRTPAEGLATILENGDVFIEESNHGRLLMLSREKAKWEFTNKINDKWVGIVSWSRYLTAEQLGEKISVLQNTQCGN